MGHNKWDVWWYKSLSSWLMCILLNLLSRLHYLHYRSSCFMTWKMSRFRDIGYGWWMTRLVVPIKHRSMIDVVIGWINNMLHLETGHFLLQINGSNTSSGLYDILNRTIGWINNMLHLETGHFLLQINGSNASSGLYDILNRTICWINNMLHLETGHFLLQINGSNASSGLYDILNRTIGWISNMLHH
jgi:hypothetical protein